jgi:signal transduction histidine kinase
MKSYCHPGGTKQTVNINDSIQSTIVVARNEWKYVAEVVPEFDSALPPVTCYAGEFNQAILNLVVNAAHAIEDAKRPTDTGKGIIRISTRQDGSWLEVRVSDTGTGIPEAVRHKIFDPFFTTKDVGKGTGQGLAVVHSVVEKHGGTIRVETEMGRGSTFIVRLPLESTECELAEAAL